MSCLFGIVLSNLLEIDLYFLQGIYNAKYICNIVSLGSQIIVFWK